MTEQSETLKAVKKFKEAMYYVNAWQDNDEWEYMYGHLCLVLLALTADLEKKDQAVMPSIPWRPEER